MSYTRVNYRDVEPAAGAMHFLRDPLECEEVGVTVVDCDPGWTGKEHDHAERNHEEVYLLMDGEATVTVDNEDIHMEPGDAIRIPPESTRQIRNGDDESTLVLAGAP
ncbi:cupin domain-containing protein [Halobaculum halobium]|uniref:Cupin domain-containing protein n=1 Tax=Halobaculum halobium TaxID=3032281 RepID=A0ABD5TEB4_9EURY|nr:cupin domain-containing protein [Halobaculum sp. SYNS20]